MTSEAHPLPLSALNDFLYCERRAGLMFIEGLRRANERTLLGDLAHEHVDTSGARIGVLNVFSNDLSSTSSTAD